MEALKLHDDNGAPDNKPKPTSQIDEFVESRLMKIVGAVIGVLLGTVAAASIALMIAVRLQEAGVWD